MTGDDSGERGEGRHEGRRELGKRRMGLLGQLLMLDWMHAEYSTRAEEVRSKAVFT